MGTVYSALQLVVDRVVAIKVPHADARGDDSARRRFRMEARAGARVLHRNIVKVFDYCESGATPYLAMEHVAGPTLGRFAADRGGLGVAAAAELVGQLLLALDEAHTCGVVHADVKPDNVLVETNREGTSVPRLIDFGLARIEGEPPLEDEQLMVSGTPEYLAPELIRAGPPTAASDLYATGIVLYELIAGTPPFGGSTAGEIMSRHVEQTAAPLSWRCHGRGITAALDAVVGRALAKSPAERFPDAITFRHALAEAVGEYGTPAPRAADAPAVEWTEAPTVTIGVAPTIEVTTRDPRELRLRAIAAATDGGDPDAIVVAYLELARAQLEAHELRDAAIDLEHGVAVLAKRAPACASTWRLLLALAGAHDGCGDRGRALAAARAARTAAREAGSRIGSERALLLLRRLRAIPSRPYR